MITSLDLSRIDDQLRKCERSKTALVLTREQGRDLMDYTRRLEMFVENLPRECSAMNKLAALRSGR